MMTKWDDVRKNVFAGCVFELLRYDVSKGRYDVMQKLYEASGISKHNILKQEKKKYYTECEPSESVYYNICFLLAEKVADNENLREMYINLYSERYPEIIERTNSSKRMMLSDASPDSKEYRVEFDAVHKMEGKYTDYNGARVFNIFRDTLAVYDDAMWNRPIIRRNFLTNKTPYEKFKQKYYQFEVEDICTYRFTDTGELIYTSKFFRRFFNKIKQIYLHTDLSVIVEQAYYTLDISQSIFTTKNWPLDWIIKRADAYIKSDETVEIYCQTKIGEICRQLKKEKKDITEKRLEKILMTANYNNAEFAREMNIIMLTCGMASLVEEFKRLYCSSFSWDQDKDFSHQRMYKQYEDQIQKKDALIESLRKENEALKEEIQKNRAKVFSDKSRKEKRLEKELKEKEKENDALKKQLEMAEQFAKAAVQKVDDSEEVDLDALKQHKYLFCAENEDILQQLSQHLPDSVYVSNTTTNFKNVKVDAVVIPTRFVSHSLYYKAKNLSNVPLIYCDGNSSKAILCEIQHEMKKKRTA